MWWRLFIHIIYMIWLWVVVKTFHPHYIHDMIMKFIIWTCAVVIFWLSGYQTHLLETVRLIWHHGIDLIVTSSWPVQLLMLCYSLAIHFEGKMKNVYVFILFQNHVSPTLKLSIFCLFWTENQWRRCVLMMGTAFLD